MTSTQPLPTRVSEATTIQNLPPSRQEPRETFNVAPEPLSRPVFVRPFKIFPDI
jgi:hypothetical protein